MQCEHQGEHAFYKVEAGKSNKLALGVCATGETEEIVTGSPPEVRDVVVKCKGGLSSS